MKINAGGSESIPGEKERTSLIFSGSRVMKNLCTCRLPALDAQRPALTILANMIVGNRLVGESADDAPALDDVEDGVSDRSLAHAPTSLRRARSSSASRLTSAATWAGVARRKSK